MFMILLAEAKVYLANQEERWNYGYPGGSPSRVSHAREQLYMLIMDNQDLYHEYAMTYGTWMPTP